jgi:hypothetical protein
MLLNHVSSTSEGEDVRRAKLALNDALCVQCVLQDIEGSIKLLVEQAVANIGCNPQLDADEVDRHIQEIYHPELRLGDGPSQFVVVVEFLHR